MGLAMTPDDCVIKDALGRMPEARPVKWSRTAMLVLLAAGAHTLSCRPTYQFVSAASIIAKVARGSYMKRNLLTFLGL